MLKVYVDIHLINKDYYSAQLILHIQAFPIATELSKQRGRHHELVKKRLLV